MHSYLQRSGFNFLLNKRKFSGDYVTHIKVIYFFPSIAEKLYFQYNFV